MIEALRRALPRLSTASSWVAPRLPREERGTSSANVSLKGATLSTPSSTADPAGSSWERARIPKGRSPDGVVEARGGAKETTALPSAPGNSESAGGSAVANAPGSPRTSIVNWSTTVPVFLTVTVHDTTEPGTTSSAFEARLTSVPMVAECRGRAGAAPAAGGLFGRRRSGRSGCPIRRPLCRR